MTYDANAIRITTMRQLLAAAQAAFDMPVSAFKGEVKKRTVAVPRQVICYIACERFGFSTPRVGQALGGRDHTTVMHACRRVAEKIGAGDPLYIDIHDALLREVMGLPQPVAMMPAHAALVPKAAPKQPPVDARPAHERIDRDDLYELAVRQAMTTDEAGEILGANRDTIRRAIKHHGLTDARAAAMRMKRRDAGTTRRCLRCAEQFNTREMYRLCDSCRSYATAVAHLHGVAA